MLSVEQKCLDSAIVTVATIIMAMVLIIITVKDLVPNVAAVSTERGTKGNVIGEAQFCDHFTIINRHAI